MPRTWTNISEHQEFQNIENIRKHITHFITIPPKPIPRTRGYFKSKNTGEEFSPRKLVFGLLPTLDCNYRHRRAGRRWPLGACRGGLGATLQPLGASAPWRWRGSRGERRHPLGWRYARSLYLFQPATPDCKNLLADLGIMGDNWVPPIKPPPPNTIECSDGPVGSSIGPRNVKTR